MKYALFFLLAFASCRKDDINKMNTCGIVVGRFTTKVGNGNKFFLKVSFSGLVQTREVTEGVYFNSPNGNQACF